MPTPEINIPLSSLPMYECGAILFSYLAFRETDAEESRAEVQASPCHIAIRAISQDDPDGQWSPQIIKPGYALLTESDVRTALRTVDQRLGDRLKAAIVAKPFLEQATTGLAPHLPPASLTSPSRTWPNTCYSEANRTMTPGTKKLPRLGLEGEFARDPPRGGAECALRAHKACWT